MSIEKFNTAVKNGSLVKNQILGKLRKGKVSKEEINLKEIIDWFNKVLPQVNVEVVEDINQVFSQGGLPALAMAYLNSVYLTKNAGDGTHFHEAFHVVFNMMLTPKQKERMLREAKRVFGEPSSELIDDLTKTYPQLSGEEIYDIALEEQLAEGFREFMLTENENNDSRWTSRLKRFFKRLWNAIKAFAGYQNEIEQLYYNISNGKFSGVQLKRNSPVSLPLYSKALADFSVVEKQNAIDLLTKFTFDALTIKAKELDLTLEDKKLYIQAFEDGGISIFTNEQEAGENGLVDNPRSVADMLYNYKATTEMSEELSEEYDKLYDAMFADEETNNPSDVFDLVLRNLKRYGVSIINNKFIEGRTFNENIDPLDEQELDEQHRENWQVEVGQVSLWSNASITLRLATNTMPVAQWTDASKTSVEEVPGYLTFPKMHSPLEAYKKIQKELGNSATKEHLVRKLDELAEHDAFFFYLKNVHSLEFPNMVQDIWLHIGQNNKPRFLDIVQRGAKLSVIDSNAMDDARTRAAAYNRGVRAGVLVNKDGTYDQQKALEYRAKFDGLFPKGAVPAKSEVDYNKIAELFKEIGFDFDPKVLESMNYLALSDMFKGSSGLQGLLTSITNGKDPLGLSDDAATLDVSGGSKVINNIAKIYSKASPEVSSDSHTKPSGGAVHQWIQPNYLSKVVNKLKDKILGLMHVDFLQKDGYYRFSPLLRDLRQSYGTTTGVLHNNLNMVIINSAKFQGKKDGVEYQHMSERDITKTVLALYYNDNSKDTFYIPTPVNSDSSAMTALEIHADRNEDRMRKNLYTLAEQEIFRVVTKEDLPIRGDKANKFIHFNDQIDTPDNRELINRLIDNADDNQAFESLMAKVRPAIDQLVKDEIAALKKELIAMDIISKEGKFTENFLGNVNPDSFLRNFVLAQMSYQLDIGNIFNGDLTYYGDSGKYYKRAKQIWSPGKYLDATKVRKNYSMKIMPDNFVYSEETINFIQGIMGEEIADKYRNKGRGSNETDAQTFIDLYRFKEIQIGLNRWTNEMEKAYKTLMSGQVNNMDVKQIFNVIKPFYFSQHSHSEIIQNEDGTTSERTTVS